MKQGFFCSVPDVVGAWDGVLFSKEYVCLIWVVVSNIFYVHPYLGKIPILTNTFGMG